MALSIVLSEGIDRNCRSGSVLSGNVQLLAAKQQPLGQVTITFAGRCKVRIERQRGDHIAYYYSKGYYFSQRQQLHEGDFTFQAGTYTWPFRFVMPSNADRGLIQSQNGKGDSFKPDPPWRGTYGEGLHPLPASFNGPKCCSVEYYLKAELTPPRKGSSLFSRAIEDKVILCFQPLMLGPGLDETFRNHEREFHVRTLKLLPEDSEERHSVRHRLIGLFQSSSLPELNLHVELSVPGRAVGTVGRAFPCLVSVSRCATAVEDTRQVPQSSVQVRRAELELRCHTRARTHSYKDHKKETMVLGAGSGAVIQIRSGDEKGKIESGQGGTATKTDLGGLIGARIPPGVTPDFSTYNISHFHTLNLKLRLQCAGEEMNFDIKDLPLEVLPQIGSQDPPTWEQLYQDDGISSQQNSDSHLLPAYVRTEESQSSSKRTERQMPYSDTDWE
jgi:Arrestin (or S-antigen), N-terminal domain